MSNLEKWGEEDLKPIRRPTCTIIYGDSREIIPTLKTKVDLIVTSPPYADARKKHYDSIHPDNFPEWFNSFSLPFYQALSEKGSLVINIKDRVVDGQRHRFVWNTILRLQENGWKSIDDYIWQKPNPMPGYWPTRLRDGWEYCFHLAKTTKPFIDQDAVKRPIGDWAEVRLKNLNGKSAVRHDSENDSGFGRDLRKWVGKETVLPSNVLTLPLVGFNKNHPAAFPVSLPEFFIRLLCPEGGTVMDPFCGSGSTGVAALSLGRNCILIDNNIKYCQVTFDYFKEKLNHEKATIIKQNF